MLRSVLSSFRGRKTPITTFVNITSSDARTHIENIQTKGFTVIKGAFSKAEANQLIQGYEEWCAGRAEMVQSFKKSSGFNSRLVNFHTVSKSAFSLFENETLLAVTDAFFNAETVVYTSLFFHEGTEQDIHRDAPYFCTFPEQCYLGVWFALEDANERNGALRVVPGGHKLSTDEYWMRNQIFKRHFSKSTTSTDIGFVHSELWNDYQSWVYEDSISRGLTVETVAANQGDIIIWHPMLPHGGSKIPTKGSSRYSMVMHVTPADVQVHGSYLFFAPELKFEARQMSYSSSGTRLNRRFFNNECGFMKDL